MIEFTKYNNCYNKYTPLYENEKMREILQWRLLMDTLFGTLRKDVILLFEYWTIQSAALMMSEYWMLNMLDCLVFHQFSLEAEVYL